MTLDLETAVWLTSPEAAHCLATAAAGEQTLVRRLAALRKEHSPARAAAVIEQLALRGRGAAKFRCAERLYFTPRALEQATDELVARYKAARMPAGSRIADLCCGIGGDLLPFADVAIATGIDRDPVAAHFAAANLSARGLRGRVVHCDVKPESVDGCDAWHLDPDRRPGGRRSVRLEHHEPGTQCIEALLSRCAHGAIKLAPAAGVPNDWVDRAELEWISRGGECKQLVAWFGALARSAGTARATVLARSLEATLAEAVLATVVGQPGLLPETARRISRFVYEPDAAVLAAGLVGVLAREHSLAAVAPNMAYLTGDEAVSNAALTRFEVLEVMPYDPRRVRAWLRARNIGRLEVKKRGVSIDPEQVRRAVQTEGEESATLLVTQIHARVTAILACRRTQSPENRVFPHAVFVVHIPHHQPP